MSVMPDSIAAEANSNIGACGKASGRCAAAGSFGNGFVVDDLPRDGFIYR